LLGSHSLPVGLENFMGGRTVTFYILKKMFASSVPMERVLEKRFDLFFIGDVTLGPRSVLRQVLRQAVRQAVGGYQQLTVGCQSWSEGRPALSATGRVNTRVPPALAHQDADGVMRAWGAGLGLLALAACHRYSRKWLSWPGLAMWMMLGAAGNSSHQLPRGGGR
jgi:hypothetical protein